MTTATKAHYRALTHRVRERPCHECGASILAFIDDLFPGAVHVLDAEATTPAGEALARLTGLHCWRITDAGYPFARVGGPAPSARTTRVHPPHACGHAWPRNEALGAWHPPARPRRAATSPSLAPPF